MSDLTKEDGPVVASGDFTMDGEGYVYWRGQHIEHFNSLSQLNDEWKAEATGKINHLLKLGVPVNVGTFIWTDDWFKDMTPDNPYLPLLRLLPNFYQHGATAEWNRRRKEAHCPAAPEVTPDGSIVVHAKRRFFRFRKGEAITEIKVEKREWDCWSNALEKVNYHNPDMGQPIHNGCCFAASAQLTDWLDRFVGPENVVALVAALQGG